MESEPGGRRGRGRSRLLRWSGRRCRSQRCRVAGWGRDKAGLQHFPALVRLMVVLELRLALQPALGHWQIVRIVQRRQCLLKTQAELRAGTKRCGGRGGCLAFVVAVDATPVLAVGNRAFWQLPCLDAQPGLQKERYPGSCELPSVPSKRRSETRPASASTQAYARHG